MAKNVKFGIEIKADTSGQESVEQLTARLDDMAKVLEGELKSEAEAVSARLRELGQQQAAISGVEQLQASVKEAGIALRRAEKEAADFAAQISKAGPPTALEAEQLQKLQSAAEAARTSLNGNKTALAGAVAELQKHGVAANQTQAAQARLNNELAELRGRAEALNPAFAGNARAAAAAGDAMQRSHRAVGEGVQSISTQLQRVQNAYLTLAGGGALGGMVKDVVQTADAWQSLGARIKLVTGEGAAFGRALQGVQEIALATRSDLEATGTLFAKIATAGKELGLSQGQALALTQTINQAIQITGGSADSAKAAILQLTQGLQSGVLRGDEFNSVMEQAPRLAQALATSLGVSTGELRTMAEQGKLTAEVVIQALQGQSTAIAAEFGKLPVTVGGALQNLSTAWTAFVGDLNQGTGATAKLATGISFLAENLDALAGAAVTLGQGALAVGLLRVTQGFLAWAGNARLAAAATASLVANTNQLSGAMAAAGQGKQAAAQKAGVLATAWGAAAAAGRGLLGLIGGPVGLVALTAAYAKDLGELAAKLVLKVQGLKNLEEIEATRLQQERAALEQAEREQEARAKQIAADKAAADAKFGLGKAAAGLVLEFDELIKKGQTTDAALANIGKGFDLSKNLGVRDAATLLDKLAESGRISAEQFRAAWAKALAGQDLAEFEKRARAALTGTERSTKQLEQALDAGLREAVRRAGLDFEQLSGGMKKASLLALADVDLVINNLDRLKAKGVDVGMVLQASFGEAIKKAETAKELQAVTERIEKMRKVLGDKIADGLLDQAAKQLDGIKKKADEVTPGINSVAEAMRELGVTSQQSLDETATKFRQAYEFMRSSGTSTARELQDAFIKYAEAAIKANGGVATEVLKAEAALRGVEIAADGTVRKMKKGFDEARESVRKTTEAVEDQITALERETAAIERANAARAKAVQLERERLNVDKDGFTLGSDGNRQAVLQQTRRSVFEEARRQGVSEQEALAIAQRFITERGEAVNFQHAGGLNAAVQQAIDQAVLRRAGSPSAPGSPGGSGGTPVIINLPSGYSQTVNVASGADANALRQLLQRLVDDRARSGGP